MKQPPMLDLDTESLRKMLSEPFTPEWRGTCELCGVGEEELQEIAGCLMCPRCYRTIARRLKEAEHPFAIARVTMDPALRGDGPPGQRKRLQAPLFKQFLEERFGSLIQAYLEAHLPLSPGSSGTTKA